MCACMCQGEGLVIVVIVVIVIVVPRLPTWFRRERPERSRILRERETFRRRRRSRRGGTASTYLKQVSVRTEDGDCSIVASHVCERREDKKIEEGVEDCVRDRDRDRAAGSTVRDSACVRESEDEEGPREWTRTCTRSRASPFGGSSWASSSCSPSGYLVTWEVWTRTPGSGRRRCCCCSSSSSCSCSCVYPALHAAVAVAVVVDGASHTPTARCSHNLVDPSTRRTTNAQACPSRRS